MSQDKFITAIFAPPERADQLSLEGHCDARLFPLGATDFAMFAIEHPHDFDSFLGACDDCLNASMEDIQNNMEDISQKEIDSLIDNLNDQALGDQRVAVLKDFHARYAGEVREFLGSFVPHDISIIEPLKNGGVLVRYQCTGLNY